MARQGLAVPGAGLRALLNRRPTTRRERARPRAAVAGLAAEASRRASAFPIAVLSLLLVIRISDVLNGGQDSQVPFMLAVFVLPVLYAVPGIRPLLSRHRWLVLLAQATLTWLPFAVFGSSWPLGVGGLLAGMVLLMLAPPLSWLLAGTLLAAETVLRANVTGLTDAPAWFGVITVMVYYADDALVFFGLVRLAQIVGELQEARSQAADLAVARERLQAAQRLQSAIGERLGGVAQMAAAARQVLPTDLQEARAHIAACGAIAREAVARARAVTAGDREFATAEPAAQAAPGPVIAPRLAWAALVAVLGGFAAESFASAVTSDSGTRLTAFAITDTALIAALQLHHSWSVRAGGTPRFWPVTLGLQAVLVYASFFPFITAYLSALFPFLAGSILLLVPGWWRWGGYAAVTVSWPVLAVTLVPGGVVAPGTQKALDGLVIAASTAAIGLVAYGLTRLAATAGQLQALHANLERAAVVQERLRITRDAHDLLGLGLSAIALKADLIGRLIGRDDPLAAAEIRELSRICAAAQVDIGWVASQGQQLTLAAELATARQILASAGVAVEANIPDRPLPAVADDLLATVLREAVTNVLRHSKATSCTIKASGGNGTLQLQVSNDGVAGPTPPNRRQGRGLANISARLRAADGHLTSRQANGTFDLLAEIPLAR